MKKLFFTLVVFSFVLNGCIRHSDQPIKRKVQRNPLEEAKKENIKRINVALMVNNVNQTIEFYNNILGFDLIASEPASDSSNYNFAIINLDGMEIMLQKKEQMIEEYPFFTYKDIGGTASLFLEVDNQMEIYNKAKEKTQIIKELHQTFHGTKEFAMLDNNGYVIIISELLK